MSLQEQLQERVKVALKAGKKEEVGALRLLVSELQRAAKDGGVPLDDEAEQRVLRREHKKRLEAAEAYRGAGRDEQLRHEEYEARLIEEFLPQRLGEAELSALVDQAIAETGALTPKDMGQVMSALMSTGGPHIDGRRASALVRERLGSGTL